MKKSEVDILLNVERAARDLIEAVFKAGVAIVERAEVAVHRVMSIDDRPFRNALRWFVEIVHVLKERVAHSTFQLQWGVFADEHAHDASSSGRPGKCRKKNIERIFGMNAEPGRPSFISCDVSANNKCISAISFWTVSPSS